MPYFDLESFRSQFQGGARAYLFLYKPNIPTSTIDAKFLVRASILPGTTIEEILVNWQGQDFKMAGKKTFTDWTITFNVDKESKLRKDFEDWSDKIHKIRSDENLFGVTTDYFATQSLSMLDYDGSEILEIKLVDAWPKEIAAITLDYSTMDVAQFDVTFTYQFHEITNI